ncbi:MAG TPA: zinc ribbon domain-containing protein [Pyrinomonadaceae bacterium]|nr:zinc ribbon domain-containing protein [Pyrinomonadaceae bacterium]
MEAVLEKSVCASCGAEVREGTSFCYACGKPVNGPAIAVPAEPIVAAAETANPSEISVKAELEAAFEKAEKQAAAEAGTEEEKNNRVRAARERQAARVAKRKAVQTEWAEPADASGIGLMAVSGVIFLITAIIVVYLEVFK